jgi:diacylglycerol kinase (ATP)
MDAQHFFILNPKAGAHSSLRRLEAELKKLEPLPFTLYITSGIGDAARFVRETCLQISTPLRFYACGGDGTLGEAAQGAMGIPHAAIAVWPCGSGNDYVKYYGGADRFLDLSRQVNAPSVLVDVIKVGGLAAINVVNIGLEAHAASTVVRIRSKPMFGGRRSYLIGAADATLRHLKTDCVITAEGKTIHEGALLTASVASGRYIGGGFLCAPRAINDDGLMDVSILTPFSRLKLVKMIGTYKRGAHLDDPAFKPYLRWLRAGHVRIECEKDTALSIDGEIVMGKSFDLELIPRAVRFILPPKLLQTEK